MRGSVQLHCESVTVDTLELVSVKVACPQVAVNARFTEPARVPVKTLLTEPLVG